MVGAKVIKKCIKQGIAAIKQTCGTMVSNELNAAKNRKITVERNEENYSCRIEINNQPSVLQKIYVKTKTNNLLIESYFICIFSTCLMILPSAVRPSITTEYVV